MVKRERTQHINNLPVASALIRGSRVSYTAVREDLGKVEAITRLAQDVLNQRAKANTAIIREIGRASNIDQVRALLTAHTPTSMVSRAPSAQTLAAIPLRTSQRARLSDALCGNKAIAFIDYDRDATLAHYLPNAPALPPSPWAGSSYGYRFVEENPTLDMRAQGNAIFACLTAREIENMLALIRAQLSYIKRITNAVDDAAKDLRRIERGVENLPLSHLRGLEQRLVHDYYLSGSRQDYTFGIDAMTYVFSLVFNSLMWVRVSVRQYQ